MRRIKHTCGLARDEHADIGVARQAHTGLAKGLSASASGRDGSTMRERCGLRLSSQRAQRAPRCACESCSGRLPGGALPQYWSLAGRNTAKYRMPAAVERAFWACCWALPARRTPLRSKFRHNTAPRCPHRLSRARRHGSSGIPAARWPPALSHRHRAPIPACFCCHCSNPPRAQTDDDGDRSSRIKSVDPIGLTPPLCCICNLPTTLHLFSPPSIRVPRAARICAAWEGRSGRQNRRGGAAATGSARRGVLGGASATATAAKARIARGCASSALAPGGGSSAAGCCLQAGTLRCWA